MRKLERPSCLGLWESARGWLGVFADMPLLRIDLSPNLYLLDRSTRFFAPHQWGVMRITSNLFKYRQSKCSEEAGGLSRTC